MATVTKPIALDESFNTTELTPRNIADVLAQELSRITGRNASQVEYDNTESGLTADNVQEALDEIVEDIPTVPSVDIQTAVDEFSTYNGGLLSSLKVALSPNQDLHGYENPWVGGASKNKLPLVLADIKSANTSGTWSGNIYSVSGGTIEVLVDDANNAIGIKPNGTFSATVIFYLVNNYTFKAGSYALNGCPTGGDSSTYELRIGNIIAQDYGSGATYTLGSDTISMASIIIRSGQDMSGKNFYPMIRLATESDPTFEPYSNICPISAHTQAKLEQRGKNLSESQTNNTDLCHVEGGKTYTLSYIGAYLFNLDIKYDGDTSYSRIVGGADVPYTFTPSRSGIINLNCFNNNISDIQVELGSSATAYEPYNGYQVTVNLGGTYYSGTLDVVSGVFVPDTAEKILPSDGWLAEGEDTGAYTNYSIKADSSYPELICSESVRATNYTDVFNNDHKIGLSTTRVIWHESTFADVTALMNYLSNNTVQIVHKLATPTPIQLSPTMVKALVGENHLSAPLEGQEITESKYRELFTWDEVEAYVNAHSGGGSGMNYSTEEQVVGTWFGKTLYQKTVDQTIGSDADYTVFANGIAHAHLVNSIFEYSSGRWFSSGYTSIGVTSNSRTCYVEVQNGALNLHNQSNSSIHWIATIQYTKTSD